MCRLVIGTPCSYCITNVAASKLDLCIFAHCDGTVVSWGERIGNLGLGRWVESEAGQRWDASFLELEFILFQRERR